MGLYRMETFWKDPPIKMKDAKAAERHAIILQIRGELAKAASRARRAKKPEQVSMVSQLKLKTAAALDKIPSTLGRRLVTL